jgi:hypothetical protein
MTRTAPIWTRRSKPWQIMNVSLYAGHAAAGFQERRTMTKASYEGDFYAWTQAQAQALRARQWNAIDLNNVVEEIESLGKEQEHAVESDLSDLLMHLLKWTYQPKRRSRSWRSSITNARQQLARRLRRNLSLRAVDRP